jgi:Zn-dependent protease with chaperone function
MLPYTWLALGVALAWFFVANVATAALLLAARRVIRPSVSRSGNALVPLAWRLLPAALSVLATCGLAIPAYLWLEPRDTQEGIGRVLGLLAAGGGVVALVSITRGTLAVRRNSRALRAAVAVRSPLKGLCSPVPAYAVRTSAPLLLLAGVFRSRLYISEGILDLLTPHELSVAIAHELAHHRAMDNLKRALLAFTPDILGASSFAGTLEREWHSAAERAADEAASQGGEADALALAAALVKVARLNADRPRLDFGYASFDDGEPIARRVRLLTEWRPAEQSSHSFVRPLLAAAVVLAVLAGAWLSHALVLAQRITEFAVHLP